MSSYPMPFLSPFEMPSTSQIFDPTYDPRSVQETPTYLVTAPMPGPMVEMNYMYVPLHPPMPKNIPLSSVAFQSQDTEVVITKHHISINKIPKVTELATAEYFQAPYYFEVTVSTASGDMAVGLRAQESGGCSVRVTSDGMTSPMPAFGVGDVVGCGIASNGRVFFTVNGKYIGTTGVAGLSGYTQPVLIFSSESQYSLHYTFGAPSPFLYQPKLMREPTTCLAGDAVLAETKIVCGNLVKSQPVGGKPGEYVVSHVAEKPGACVAWREGQAQVHPPLSLKHPHPYFEMKILTLPHDTVVGIGLCEQYATQESYRGLPGWRKRQVGLHSDDGHVYNGEGKGTKVFPIEGMKSGDVVGCGVDAMFRVFFTLNGRLLGAPVPLPCELDGVCMTVGLDEGTSVQVNVTTFVYDARNSGTALSPVGVRSERAPVWVDVTDALLNVLSYLYIDDLLRTLVVCRRFHEAGVSDTIWRPIYNQPKYADSSRRRAVPAMPCMSTSAGFVPEPAPTLPTPEKDFMLWYFHRIQVQRTHEQKMYQAQQMFSRRNEVRPAKPVIYMYSSTDCSVDVSVSLSSTSRPGEWFTYPEPNIATCRSVEWHNVRVCAANVENTPSSNPIDMKNEDSGMCRLLVDGGAFEVPYLFWEACIEPDPIERTRLRNAKARIVCRRAAELESVLPNVLRSHGLNDVEISDFVAYWVPQVCRWYGSESCVQVDILTPETVDDVVGTLDVSLCGGNGSRRIDIHRVYATFSQSTTTSGISMDEECDYDVSHVPVGIRPVVSGCDDKDSNVVVIEWGGMFV